MWLNCEQCKDCAEREKTLSAKLDALLGDMNEHFISGKKHATKQIITVLEGYLKSLDVPANDSPDCNDPQTSI